MARKGKGGPRGEGKDTTDEGHGGLGRPPSPSLRRGGVPSPGKGVRVCTCGREKTKNSMATMVRELAGGEDLARAEDKFVD
jgi:hypothetical protein